MLQLQCSSIKFYHCVLYKPQCPHCPQRAEVAQYQILVSVGLESVKIQYFCGQGSRFILAVVKAMKNCNVLDTSGGLLPSPRFGYTLFVLMHGSCGNS